MKLLAMIHVSLGAAIGGLIIAGVLINFVVDILPAFVYMVFPTLVKPHGLSTISPEVALEGMVIGFFWLGFGLMFISGLGILATSRWSPRATKLLAGYLVFFSLFLLVSIFSPTMPEYLQRFLGNIRWAIPLLLADSAFLFYRTRRTDPRQVA